MSAAWNFVNSSACNSSLAKINLTTCCGSSVNDPRLRTSLPCSSTNSNTWKGKRFSSQRSKIAIVPFGQEIWCTCTGYISLLMPIRRRRCRRLCNIVQNQRTLCEVHLIRNNLQRSLHLRRDDKKGHIMGTDKDHISYFLINTCRPTY